MFKGISSLIASAAFLLVASQASATIIQDNYVGSDDHGYGDVIASASEYNHYNISNMDVSFGGGVMTVRVNTGFSEADDNYGVEFGDLFISTNGWHPNGSAPYYADDASNGEDWEFVFDTSQNTLYGGSFSILNSEDLTDSTRYIFRNGQEVQRGTGGTAIKGGSVDLSHAGLGGYVEYNILLSDLGISGDTQIGLKWGMTCANDTIEGAASVPEPSALMLLGLGLLGLGFTARKRSN